jgi:serine/threonine protein phosphatase PrpC
MFERCYKEEQGKMRMNLESSLKFEDLKKVENVLESKLTEKELSNMMTKICKRIDKALNSQQSINSVLSGSTGVIGLFLKEKIVIANVGDSRAVLMVRKSNGRIRIKPLTTDHLPTLEAERDRILKAGGDIHPSFCKTNSPLRNFPLRIFPYKFSLKIFSLKIIPLRFFPL